MKLKYYLRGLGTGIAVTALIIGISSIASPKKTMTDDEVIVRAKELGMVERTVLADTVEESEESEEESEPEGQTQSGSGEVENVGAEISEFEALEITEEAERIEEPKIEEEPESIEEPKIEEEPELSEEMEVVEEPEVIEHETAMEELPFGMPDEAGTILLNVSRGDSSVSVSRRLEELGLIESAEDFDKYLCRNGYDKKIQTGNYEIAVNATQEEIARMITTR